MDVRVQVPAYHEPDVDETLEAIVGQNVPADVDVGVEAWVTPALGTYDDPTFRAAESVDGVDVELAPAGKLSARNLAHDTAAEQRADVVVTWDADAPPTHENVLLALLIPFDDDDVVAVNSTPRSPPDIWGLATNAGRPVARALFGHLHGQCSAFTSEAWIVAGPFADEKVDQTNLLDVWAEEEVRFANSLRALGRVERAPDAVVVNDTRRFRCRVANAFAWSGRPRSGRCAEVGATTFGLERERREHERR